MGRNGSTVHVVTLPLSLVAALAGLWNGWQIAKLTGQVETPPGTPRHACDNPRRPLELRRERPYKRNGRGLPVNPDPHGRANVAERSDSAREPDYRAAAPAARRIPSVTMPTFSTPAPLAASMTSMISP